MYCDVCYERLPKDRRQVRLACPCLLCLACFREWVLQACTAAHFTCPNLEHRVEITAELLRKYLRKQDWDSYNEALTKLAIQREDYLSCGKCGSPGWETNLCVRGVQCGVCGHHFPLLWSQTTVQTWILREIVAFPCPNCTIYIEKTGGCDHMTCKTCGYEFCWECLQDYHAHNETRCEMRTALPAFWLVMLPQSLVWKVMWMYRGQLNELWPYVHLAILIFVLSHYVNEALPGRWIALVMAIVGVWMHHNLLVQLIIVCLVSIVVTAPLLGVTWLRLRSK